MAYCTELDLLIHISATDLALLTGDPTGTTIDSIRVAACCEAASQEMDLIFCARFVTPIIFFPTVGSSIASMSIDITFFNLYKDAYKNVEIPQDIVWARINALAECKKIASGEREINYAITIPGYESVFKNNRKKSYSFALPGNILLNSDLDDYYDAPL